ncbi:hypothetical protein [Trinickia mobilis]|uniref:hypothetical protein n=1 Tax=Trinickia mobilis TaxID=2816356 RepID=UPI001A8DD968|nr:hypothetical protein [Trinickia mobilis]
MFIAMTKAMPARDSAKRFASSRVIPMYCCCVRGGSLIFGCEALGAAIAGGTFILTTSFVFSTPGITLTSPSSFPIISTLLEQ